MRVRVLGCALLSAFAVGTAGLQAPVAAAPRTATSTSDTLKEQVARLSAEIDRVGAQLAKDAQAYEEAETALGSVTQQQFAARADRDALVAAESESRTALQGLARAAYKGGVPPMVTALMSGDPGALSQLAYVQRSVNRVGVSRNDLTRDLAAQQAGAGKALERSDALRRKALAQRQALELQRQELAARTTKLTADLQAAGAKLIQARAAEAARLAGLRLAAQQQAAAMAAQRAMQAAAAGIPYVGSMGGGGGLCQPPSSYGEANGFLSDASLCPVDTVPGHRLRTDAARAFDALNRARIASTGQALCITDSYRSYPEQVDVFRRKPTLAATPGRSQHGWGLALDLGCGVQGFGSEPHRWMQLNAWKFGWIHPAWAQQSGSKPEAWHWEYVGVAR
ncbi:MAG: peptidase and DD-carboxypeptidase VanY/endolysin [Frankiales bacterium]|nr:peptidase and DD-carboxypeptidase VanY/endolysin [Frankiales bacterium]